MNEFLKDRIVSLCEVMSISGFETRATDFLRERIGKDFDQIETDAVGNHLFWKRCGREHAPLILLDTHFDEIGMMVTEVCENGFLRLAPIGGLSLPVLQAADVIVWGKETLRGVITSTPPHLRDPKEDVLADLSELMVDTGYDKEELERLTPPGTPVGFAPCYSVLNGECLAGKSFDNKACAAIAAYAVAGIPREAMAADVALMFSCYEETSLLGGATSGTFRLKPDYAMVIDVNLAAVPDVPKAETVPLGEGVSLSLSAATDRKLTGMTRMLCKEHHIPHTMIAAPSSTGTNATAVHLVGAGVPVVDVGLPLRNMHTYNEVIAMKDAESLCRLIEKFIQSEEIANTFGTEGEEMPI